MKGQYLTVEYIIFFVIGILMILSVYYVFININSISSKSTTEAQLEATGQMIIGTIVKVLEISNTTNSTIYYNLSIPPRLSQCEYMIKFDNGLNLNCTPDIRTGVILTSYNFNIETEDIIYSSRSRIEIIADNGRIELK